MKHHWPEIDPPIKSGPLPKITIAVQCHNFERRFGWMLASLAAQSRERLISVDVAFLRSAEKMSKVEETCRRYDDKLAMRYRGYNLDRLQYRGLTRTDQLQECETEWIMFADCDMVYHPKYFEALSSFLSGHPRAKHMFSSGRMSNDKETANQVVNAFGDDPPNIGTAYETACRIPGAVRRGNVGAGFCQIVNVKHCPHGGYYVKPEENRDRSWAKGSLPKSDMQFRKRINRDGGPRQALPEWFDLTAIHLNHDRDPDAGFHLETQR